MKRPHAAQCLDGGLHEDAGRLLHVVARALQQPGHLPEFRQHATGPFGRRRIVEQHLTGQAQRHDVSA